MPWKTLHANAHLQTLVIGVLTQLRSGQLSDPNLLQLRRLVGGATKHAQLLEVFERANATRYLKDVPDTSSGLAHLHVMKTAGTSFFNALETAMSREGVWVNSDVLAVLPAEIRSSTPLISGHFPYEARKLIGRDRMFSTILRNPRHRVLSHYHEVRSIFLRGNDDACPTLEEFLWSDRWIGLSSNYQTRQLGFEIGLETLGVNWDASNRFRLLGPPFPEEHELPLTSLFDSIRITDWSTAFNRASDAIEEISVILTAERLYLAPAVVELLTGISLQEIPRLNTRVYDEFESLPVPIQRRIDEINEHDSELWRLADERMTRDLLVLNN
jgi:hypothetical protein